MAFRLKVGVAALMLVAVVSMSANAAIIGSATLIRQPPGTPFTAPDALLPAPWESYQLSIVGTEGENIAGWSFRIDTMLHQRWADPDFDDVPNKSTAGPASNTRGDSHLTTLAGDLVLGADEDNDMSTSPLSPNNTYTPGAFTGGTAWGVGSFLEGDNGIAFANQSSTANVALIVIPHDKVLSLLTADHGITISALVANTSGDVIATLDECDFFSCIPEPSTVMLAGLALVGLVGFGRRRV